MASGRELYPFLGTLFSFLKGRRPLLYPLPFLLTSMCMVVTVVCLILKNLLDIIKILSFQRSIKGPAFWPKPKILTLWLLLPQFLGRMSMFVILLFHNIALS